MDLFCLFLVPLQGKMQGVVQGTLLLLLLLLFQFCDVAEVAITHEMI
jgi:hypothetical protein